MKINIDPKSELLKWGPINCKPLYPSGWRVLYFESFTRYSLVWPPSILIGRKGKGLFVIDYRRLRKIGFEFFSRWFLNRKNYRTLWRQYEDWLKRYEKAAREFSRAFRPKLTKQKLLFNLEKLHRFNTAFWVIVGVPEISNYGAEPWLKRKLEKINKAKAESWLEILCAPTKLSFFQEEELALLRLAEIKDKRKLADALKKHAQAWHWILNTYAGNRILTPQYFSKRLKALVKDKPAKEKIKEIEGLIVDNKRRKAALAKKIKLEKKLIFAAEQLSQSIWWQDHRKGYIWRQDHLWDMALKAIARNTNWKFTELQYCSFEELPDVVRGKIKKSDILPRRKDFLFYWSKKNYEKTADAKEIEKIRQKYVEEKIIFTKEIKGLLVSRGPGGLIRGRVRVINNPLREVKDFRPGEILVAGMTSPEYIVVMKKAKAVITDFGGITCHAAIVSRELKIPCLVGTKIATKILHNGDLVELDADKGIVKRLN